MYSDIRLDLWLKLQPTLPADEEKGEFTFLNKVIHFDKKKRTLKREVDKESTLKKAMKLCSELDDQVPPTQLKQKPMIEIVNMIIAKVPVDADIINGDIYINRATLKLTTRDNNISMNLVRALCRKYEISWQKEVHDTYKVEVKPKSTNNLVNDLNAKKIPIPLHYVKKTLTDLAMTQDIPHTKSVEKGVAKSWVNKAKGMLQIAWEQGLLDLDLYCVEDFSAKGMVDGTHDTNLTSLLSECSDFIEEEYLLQLNLRLLGATCIRSLKYHCEIAGEGIKYIWGNAKAKYRKVRVKDKKTLSNSGKR